MKIRGLTPYQVEILLAVQRCASEGFDIDLDQMLDCLTWKPTKQSLQFSIRALIAKGMLAKTDHQVRRGRKRVCFKLTVAAATIMDPRISTAPEVPSAPEEQPDPGLSEDLPWTFESDDFQDSMSGEGG
jgi:hypothetical protein